jgi:hypothetical protein
MEASFQTIIDQKGRALAPKASTKVRFLTSQINIMSCSKNI